MTPADIRVWKRRTPFIPFRIVTSDGAVYEVRHPNLVMIGLASVIIGYPSEQDPHIYSRWDIVSMRHIVRLEPEQEVIAEA